MTPLQTDDTGLFARVWANARVTLRLDPARGREGSIVIEEYIEALTTTEFETALVTLTEDYAFAWQGCSVIVQAERTDNTREVRTHQTYYYIKDASDSYSLPFLGQGAKKTGQKRDKALQTLLQRHKTDTCACCETGIDEDAAIGWRGLCPSCWEVVPTGIKRTLSMLWNGGQGRNDRKFWSSICASVRIAREKTLL